MRWIRWHDDTTDTHIITAINIHWMPAAEWHHQPTFHSIQIYTKCKAFPKEYFPRLVAWAGHSADWSVNIPLQEPAVYGGGAEPASIMNAAANEFGEMLRHPEWTVDTAGPHLALWLLTHQPIIHFVAKLHRLAGHVHFCSFYVLVMHPLASIMHWFW